MYALCLLRRSACLLCACVLRRSACLLCACVLWAMATVPACAAAAPNAPATAGSAASPQSPDKAAPAASAPVSGKEGKAGRADREQMSAIFYYNTRGFVISPPMGWVNDAQIARHLGVSAFFVPMVGKGEVPAGAIYLRLFDAQGRGEAAVDAQTAFVAADMAKRFPGLRPVVEKGEAGVIASGEPLYLRRINQAPPPNSWESVVYVESDGVMLSLVLLCKTPAARQLHEAALLAMAKDMTMLEVKHEK